MMSITFCRRGWLQFQCNVGCNQTFHTTEAGLISETGEDRHLPTINVAVFQKTCLQEG